MPMMSSIDTKAAVGVLTSGSFGITHVLSISCESEAELNESWQILRLCQHWQISAGYKADSALLTLWGWGDPVTVIMPSGLMHILPTYQATWTMEDPDAVRFFMAGCKRHGYCALLPAINMRVVETRRPILAFLKSKGGAS